MPPASARIDTPRALAHLVMSMTAKLTFTAPPTPAGVAIYGARMPALCAPARHAPPSLLSHAALPSPLSGTLGGSWDQSVIEDITDWLMDASKCPTTWAPLLSIRQQHGAQWRSAA